MKKIFDYTKCYESIVEKGYYVFTQEIGDKDHARESAINFYKENPWFSKGSNDKYNRGGIGRSTRIKYQNDILSNLVYNEYYDNFFKKFFQVKKTGVIAVSHEYKEVKHKYIEENSKGIALLDRNGWLHFDRNRSLKPLVYIKDVSEKDGPFTVVEGSHTIGAELRKQSSSLPYDMRKNRIDIDFPEIKYTKKPLVGAAGTTIIFDSDIFHEGGNILSPEGERIIIRSHWR